MQLYLDTGNISEIQEIAEIGILNGVTTNPTLIMKEGLKFEDVIKEIAGILKKHASNSDFTVSAEVTAENADDMVKEAIPLTKINPHVIIKVPLTEEGLKAVQILSKKKIKTNVTLCFSANQALLAAKAGAYIISPFIGRIDDAGQEGIDLIDEIREIYDNYGFKTKILAASIRSARDVKQVALSGADIATIPYAVFKKLFRHPLTDRGLIQFNSDWEQYKHALQK